MDTANDRAAAQFDCRKCGACCAEFDVFLSDAEADHFESDPRLVELTVLTYPRPAFPVRFMLRRTGQCAALAGTLGDCSCNIYPDRPHLCVAFEAGSEDCLKTRRKYGFPT
ncbi:MAG: YkgJ family cysteine cluster protein [Phycisphaerae bacterium]